jgi:hypothetical protein
MNFLFRKPQSLKHLNKFGKSFMVLKKNVKKRATIASKKNEVSTLEYCLDVLSKFSEAECYALHCASKKIAVKTKAKECFRFVHVHGPVIFENDVEIIYAPLEEIEKVA